MIRALATVLVGIGIFIYVQQADAAVPMPSTVPEVRFEHCPVLPNAACTWPGGPIYMGEAERYLNAQRGLVHTLWHELGHQFDYQVMHEPQRLKFAQLVGGVWNSEQFAEAYALCVLDEAPRHGRYVGNYGYREPTRRHRRICKLIENAGIIEERSGQGPDSLAAHGTPQRAL